LEEVGHWRCALERYTLVWTASLSASWHLEASNFVLICTSAMMFCLTTTDYGLAILFLSGILSQKHDTDQHRLCGGSFSTAYGINVGGLPGSRLISHFCMIFQSRFMDSTPLLVLMIPRSVPVT
jgi:hypothetical protein